jgi:mRNA interferase HigB
MQLLRRDLLLKAIRKHPDARGWIARWTASVEEATWRSIQEVRVDYPSADGIALASGVVVTVFNVKGNEYRLLTYVDYSAQFVQFLELITHAEYDKELWKRRY